MLKNLFTPLFEAIKIYMPIDFFIQILAWLYNYKHQIQI